MPPNAKLLAGSEFCPLAMYQIGESIMAMQGHPEFTRDYAADLMSLRREVIGAETVEAGLESLKNTTDEQMVARWILRFFQAAKVE